MKNLALSLTAEDIQRFVTKTEADGKTDMSGAYHVPVMQIP